MARKAKNTRMCVGCRQCMERSELIRIYKLPDGSISASFKNSRDGGRGLYICPTKKCFEMAVKKKSFTRSFKCELPQSVYAEIEEFVKPKDME
ncbi:MAG: YlxR family protein [Clostridia bacterium]|nr:YlxR family protein [Clostridia bacterium]